MEDRWVDPMHPGTRCCLWDLSGGPGGGPGADRAHLSGRPGSRGAKSGSCTRRPDRDDHRLPGDHGVVHRLTDRYPAARGRLAQVARALPLQGRGREFESLSAHCVVTMTTAVVGALRRAPRCRSAWAQPLVSCGRTRTSGLDHWRGTAPRGHRPARDLACGHHGSGVDGSP